MAQVTLRIKRVYLEQMVFGTKRIEYRDGSEFNARRLMREVTVNKDGSFEGILREDVTHLKLYCPLGQSGNKLEALFPVNKLEVDMEKEQFLIHAGNCIEHNLPAV